MELCGHVLGLFRALRPFYSFERTNELISEIAPKLVLTDTIRCLVKPTEQHPEVVKFGRGYSHCTDGCAMRLPINDELKKFSNITETEFVYNPAYVSKFADEPTDFQRFFEINSRLFQNGNESWGLAVLAHLQQDVATDITWQHNLCKCDTSKGKVTYTISGRIVTGKEFREDMVIANIWFHRYFRQIIKSEFGDDITQEWLNKNVCKSFYEAYPDGMADNSCQYLRMDRRVFDDSEEVDDSLIDILIEHGLINCKDDLKREADILIGSAVGSCATLVNYVRLLD